MLRSCLTVLTLCLALGAGIGAARAEDGAAPAIFRGHAGGDRAMVAPPPRGVGSRATCQDSTQCAVTLSITGVIEAGMEAKVRQALAERGGDGPISVALDSRGGDLGTALQIGYLLHAAGASVSVAPSAICASACTFILAAGVQRSVRGKIGIHRPRPTKPPSESERHAEAALNQRIVATLHTYAADMHVSDRWIEDMLAVPPESVKWLSHADLDRYGMGS